MKNYFLFILLFCVFSCKKSNIGIETSSDEGVNESIVLTTVLEEENLSVRALEIDQNGMVVYSGNNGRYGFIDPSFDIDRHEQIEDEQAQDKEFRGISFHSIGASFISAGNPAQVYKVSYIDFIPELTYFEEDEKVFYDAMEFWNDSEGIAFGDAMGGCMSVIITRNGGESWKKLSCDEFPSAYEGEGAFAASDTNIKVVGDHTWLASKHKIYYSPDKGESWTVIDTPIIQETETQGIYSLDFYDQNIGVAIGGDYTEADANKNNLMKTIDGGKSWTIISSDESPGYRSCIQFIPNSGGQGMLAVGYKGIDISTNGGKNWRHISDESFYTVRFINDKEGYLAGKERIAKFMLK